MLKKFFLIIAAASLLFWPVGAGQAQNWTGKVTAKIIILTAEVYNDSWDFTLTDPYEYEVAGIFKIIMDPDFQNNKLIVSIDIQGIYKAEIYNGELKQEISLSHDFGLGTSAEIKIVFAAGASFGLQNPLQAESFQELVENMINFVWVISLVVAPLMLLLAGFFFLTAGGRPGQILTAKKMIFWTILGFVIITLAEGIIAMLKGILGG